MNFHLAITYPDGRTFNGKRSFIKWPGKFGLDQIDFTGKHVLDIATDEGYWAFWSEWQGAQRVLAIDVEKGDRYDWGATIDWAWVKELERTRVGKKAFDLHHRNLNSKVEYLDSSVYDVVGQFDILFNCGLTYHLRHPLLSFDCNRKATRGFMFLETLVDDRCGEDKPICWFYPGKAPTGQAPSNWSGMSTACVVAYLRNAGFSHVYIGPRAFPFGTRRVFMAVVANEYRALFDAQESLTYCDEDYWARIETEAKW